MTRNEYENMCRKDVTESIENGDLPQPKDNEQFEYLVQMSIESGNEKDFQRYILYISYNNNVNKVVKTKYFDNPNEFAELLNKYEGYHCKIVDKCKSSIILDGAFDSSFLDEEYYVG